MKLVAIRLWTTPKMFYIQVALGITGYFVYGKPADAKRQLEVIKKLTFSLNLG